jgi:hypothetical protein
MSSYDDVSIFETTFINSGKTPASNVRLTMYYPGQEIKNYSVIEASENASFAFFNSTP